MRRHLDFCMTELGGSCSCGAKNAPPDWATQAFRILATPGVRIKRWRLTETEADELRAYTGQNGMLLGRPVEIKTMKGINCG